MKTKQIIILRKDKKMSIGKSCSQAAHASLKFLAYQAMNGIGLSDIQRHWLENGSTKITVSVNSEEELLALYQKAVDSKLTVSLIKDAGKTEFKEPTYTAIAIGPDLSDEIDVLTNGLKLL